MCIEHFVVPRAAVAVVTGPSIRGWRSHHARTHRIELDIAMASEYVGRGIDQARAEPPFPQRAGPRIAAARILYQAPPHSAAARCRTLLLGRGEEAFDAGC